MAGRKIYISPKGLKIIAENIGKMKFPSYIENEIRKNWTSIGNSPAIPQYHEDQFLLKLVALRYENVVAEAEKYFKGILDKDISKLQGVLSKMLFHCQEIEKKFRTNLEKICFNYVVETLSVPEGYISFVPRLVDDIPEDEQGKNDLPDDGDEEGFQYDDDIDMSNINGEVNKRRLLNCIILGGSMEMLDFFLRDEEKMKEIANIDNRLPELYKKIDALNNYIMFVSKDSDYERTTPSGVSGLKLGNDIEKTLIHPKGTIFNALVIESFRAFFKLAISHGLPKDRDRAAFVELHSDYYMAEPWDMRMGPNMFHNIFLLKDIDYQKLPAMFMEISMLPPKEFNCFMRNTLGRTRKGDEMVMELSDEIGRRIEQEDFDNEMAKKRSEKGIIEDDFIKADEL